MRMGETNWAPYYFRIFHTSLNPSRTEGQKVIELVSGVLADFETLLHQRSIIKQARNFWK
jgi:hypothetical protein